MINCLIAKAKLFLTNAKMDVRVSFIICLEKYLLDLNFLILKVKHRVSSGK